MSAREFTDAALDDFLRLCDRHVQQLTGLHIDDFPAFYWTTAFASGTPAVEAAELMLAENGWAEPREEFDAECVA